jgi:hypothetical protein
MVLHCTECKLSTHKRNDINRRTGLDNHLDIAHQGLPFVNISNPSTGNPDTNTGNFELEVVFRAIAAYGQALFYIQ